MLVHEVMTHNPTTVTEDTTVKAAITLLARHRFTALPVVDDAGRPCGVVSEADLIRELVPRDARAHLIPDDSWRDRPGVVGEVMTPHAVTVRPDTDLAAAVDLVVSTSIKSVPVVGDDGRLAGMFSRSDVVHLLARADDDVAHEVDEMLVSVGLGAWAAVVLDGTVTLTGPAGPAHTHDAAVARLVAGTVRGVVDVERD